MYDCLDRGADALLDFRHMPGSNRKPDQRKRLVGTWRCCDLFSDVRIKISLKAGQFVVSAIDQHDGETASVYDVAWNAEQLEVSFAAHWSSGRFVRYRFTPSFAEGRLDLTYTYTAQETWEREP